MLDLTVNDPSNGETMAPILATVHTRCSSRSPHSLQNLPLELLESIFLYSKNFALPRSSPLLGAKLSGKATLLRLFMVGFHDTWHKLFGIPVQEEASYPPFYAFPDNDVSLQFDLLSMPWVDIDFILEAQQIWADKFARGRCYRHYETEGSSIHKLYKTNVHARDRYMQHIRQHQEKTWKFDARACFEADYERALQFPPGLEIHGIARNNLLGSSDVHPKVRLPVDLVTGPWNEEKKRRLFWLVRAGAVWVSHGAESSWKATLAGLDAAVITPEKPDPFIVRCLFNPCILVGLPPDAAHNRLVMMCRRIARGGDTEDMRQILRVLISVVHHDQQIMLKASRIDNNIDDNLDDDEDGDADVDSDDEFYDKLYNELVEEGVEYVGWGG
ncbi:uncharacterized protein CPUR_08776 [Claviceps purpurea 20.1]|uniref:Uncharacterized protein n=1 Tax=Claviceps purpurea (strain 20.1) TaxID=1111077 RepID=M1VZD1_CLAP2|nr:uncharacterized protein CPUR_08776 [Claviceps purpurea 20.1]